MHQLHASIDRVIQSARRLRDIAGEEGQIELKSQIIDEISTLQELRDELDVQLDGADSSATVTSVESDTETISTSGFKMEDNSMSVIQPSGDTDTYGISEFTEEPVPDEQSAAGQDADEAASAEPDDAMQKRSAKAEARIAELEPLHAAAAKRVNDVLTPEQNQIRIKATKAARAAGKTGAEARQYIYGAMKLSQEQRVKLSTAKKELASIREAIAKEVEFLLDDDQKKRVASVAHIQLTEAG